VDVGEQVGEPQRELLGTASYGTASQIRVVQGATTAKSRSGPHRARIAGEDRSPSCPSPTPGGAEIGLLRLASAAVRAATP